MSTISSVQPSAGLGLTGVIEWVELQLAPIQSAYLDVEILPYENLDAFWPLAEESVAVREHTVAWVDCMSRGVHARAGACLREQIGPTTDALTPIRIGLSRMCPSSFPGFALNRLSVGAFNEAYYHLHRLKKKKVRQHYSTYFYPLDSILNWNRLYGFRGMMQYQCVIPPENAKDAMRALLIEISKSGQASFLAVMKTFGDRPSPGMLSFPRPGATLSLDFPYRGDATLALMSRLDAIVRDARGALYPGQGRTYVRRDVQAFLPAMGVLGRTQGSRRKFRLLAKGFDSDGCIETRGDPGRDFRHCRGCGADLGRSRGSLRAGRAECGKAVGGGR